MISMLLLEDKTQMIQSIILLMKIQTRSSLMWMRYQLKLKNVYDAHNNDLLFWIEWMVILLKRSFQSITIYHESQTTCGIRHLKMISWKQYKKEPCRLAKYQFKLDFNTKLPKWSRAFFHFLALVLCSLCFANPAPINPEVVWRYLLKLWMAELILWRPSHQRLSKVSAPRGRTKKEFLRINSVYSSPTSNYNIQKESQPAFSIDWKSLYQDFFKVCVWQLAISYPFCSILTRIRWSATLIFPFFFHDAFSNY